MSPSLKIFFNIDIAIVMHMITINMLNKFWGACAPPSSPLSMALLNPVRILVMEVLAYDMCGLGWVSHAIV